MRVKRFFSAMLVYVLVFSLSIPVSAAELVSATVGVAENIISVSGNDVMEVTVSDGDSKEDDNKAVAVELPVYESGNSFADAIPYDFGTKYYGSISADDASDYYELTLNESGRININATAEMYRIRYYLYDAEGNCIWETYVFWNNVTQMSVSEFTFDLKAGTYYLLVSQFSSDVGNYNVTIDYASAQESFKETAAVNNNNIATANTIALGTAYRGQLAFNDNVDFYQFTLPSSSNFTLDISGDIQRSHYYLYDANFNEVKWEYVHRDGVTNTISKTVNLDLVGGTYYLAIKQYSGYTGTYTVTVKADSAGESFKEDVNAIDNSMETANAISTGATYKGQIAYNDVKDFYIFTLKSQAEVEINAEAFMPRVNYLIYDVNSVKKWSLSPSYNSVTGKSDITELVTLEAGTYYFVVEKYGANTGNYSFNISEHSHKYVTTVTPATTSSNGKVVVACECGKLKSEKTLYAASNIKLSKTAYTYDGKAKKPSVVVKDSKGKKISASNYTVTYAKGRKDVGKYKVTIKFKGNYKGTVTQTFTINPKKTSITKLTAAKKGFTVKWKKVPKQATGYEVQYSTTSSFAWSVKTKTVKPCSKTSLKVSGLYSYSTYYVRVRTYKTVKGKKYYSDWTKAKKVRIK